MCVLFLLTHAPISGKIIGMGSHTTFSRQDAGADNQAPVPGKARLLNKNVPHTELKQLFPAINENPYRRLNIAFLLMSVIPLLALIYIFLIAKNLVGDMPASRVWPILGPTAVILILGYVVAYGVIKNIINKTLSYAAQAKHADELKSTFAMSLAHDLKSPIATIMANISNLQAGFLGFLGNLTEKQIEAVTICKDVATRMNTITTDLINVHIFEARETELVMTRFDLRKTLDAQHRELASVARIKNISLHAELPRKSLYVRADPEKITRAINNLLSNSIKHTPDGGKVKIKAHAVDGLARVYFLNTGTPIPSDKLQTIFTSIP